MKVFECKLCGNCCHGKGGIYVSEGEIESIASFMKMDKESFASKFLYKNHGRIYIASGKDGYCVFFDIDRKCLIHPVKPEICRIWPFFPANLKDRQSWEIARIACLGINPDASFEEFIEESKEIEK
ncbi:MAG: YkgJ family cysteine cluster protein [Deltaproteobacteria bacterium]|nr:YkgJ family cysteine cluster protein [Deltaproteobacteria bacterium]